MKLHRLPMWLALPWLLMAGCAYIPEKRTREVVHNPFPQIKRVAVLPFFNQSSEPTLNSDRIAENYYAALQAIPGFEVLPVGVAKSQWIRFANTYGEPSTGRDFQKLAQEMGVEAIVVGSVTDFDPYYPPRMAMTVRWYAANEGFHTIPAGYGLPWGTEAEKRIPRRIAREAEFELARSQLATQTPDTTNLTQVERLDRLPPPSVMPNSDEEEPAPIPPTIPEPPADVPADPTSARVAQAGGQTDMQDGGQTIVRSDGGFVGDTWVGDVDVDGVAASGEFPAPVSSIPIDPVHAFIGDGGEEMMPINWPEPTDLIPDPPQPNRPAAVASHEPILSHTKLYRGDDSYFTNRLADYVETGDDARPGGWQDYLKRSDDFIHFCCHLHITEMLESRGGSDQSEFILRWPVSRY